MSTVEGIQLLVKTITALSNSLPRTVPTGSVRDKIYVVMHTQEGDTPFETFNKRFDTLFGQDCRNSDGRLHHIRQGKNGMGIICAYLNTIDWTRNFPLDLAEIKLLRLKTELTHLRYAFRVDHTHVLINIFRGSGEDLLLSTRPSRHVVPTSRLTNADNIEKAQLSFQRKAVEDFRTRQDTGPGSSIELVQRDTDPTVTGPGPSVLNAFTAASSQPPASVLNAPNATLSQPPASGLNAPTAASSQPPAQLPRSVGSLRTTSSPSSTPLSVVSSQTEAQHLKRNLSSVVDVDDEDADEDASIQPERRKFSKS
jgi:hypothetical protein